MAPPTLPQGSIHVSKVAQMRQNARPHHVMSGLRQILSHVLITLLAVLIAFALPAAASYILFDWWPLVEREPNLLLASEIILASLLVLLFNLAKITWDSRHQTAIAGLASLVHARNTHGGWLARRRERNLIRHLPAARDACILTQTGYDTLVEPGNPLHGVLQSAYELRVMMVNPAGEALRRHVGSLPQEATLLTFHTEIESSVAFLAGLRRLGKKVALKFYDENPFWNLVVLGDHVWVQHCHCGFGIGRQPEYVFALRHDSPHQGLFVPFYAYFLNFWSEPRHPEYDFESSELVYRDGAGRETSRAPLGVALRPSMPSANG